MQWQEVIKNDIRLASGKLIGGDIIRQVFIILRQDLVRIAEEVRLIRQQQLFWINLIKTRSDFMGFFQNKKNDKIDVELDNAHKYVETLFCKIKEELDN